MVLLSITGTVRMVLIIIAVFVILRFIGRLMAAKRNHAAEQQHKLQQEEIKKAKAASERNKGKVEILSKGNHNAEDVDYEEL